MALIRYTPVLIYSSLSNYNTGGPMKVDSNQATDTVALATMTPSAITCGQNITPG
jgi:hypothetical protein